jgi:site-specific recombinase XerD
MLSWLLNVGKNPDRAEGYAYDTVHRSSYRIDQLYRWVWDSRGYTTQVSTEDGDKYLQKLAYDDTGDSHKSKCVKALKRFYKWREHELDGDSWEPELKFSSNSGRNNPRDYFTKEERAKLREAALEYGSVPNYRSLTPEERDRWKKYLAQRFEKPKSEVTEEDWSRANGWKIPSLVWASLDAGLRPIEVSRASTSWVDVENSLLRIPVGEASKSFDHWRVSLQERTAEILNRWVEEREQYQRYQGQDNLWLTREGNPYVSSSLRYTLGRLCEIADIPTENRQASWYAIRHSVGTYMTREEGLAAAQTQLRHKSEVTTMKYDQAPAEDRQNALGRMG